MAAGPAAGDSVDDAPTQFNLPATLLGPAGRAVESLMLAQSVPQLIRHVLLVSRALTEGLTAQQSAAEFDDQLDAAVKSIYEASLT